MGCDMQHIPLAQERWQSQIDPKRVEEDFSLPSIGESLSWGTFGTFKDAKANRYTQKKNAQLEIPFCGTSHSLTCLVSLTDRANTMSLDAYS